MDLLVRVRRVGDPAAIGRPGRHGRVAIVHGQLVRRWFTQPDSPDRSFHRKGDFLPVRRPAREVWAVGDLWKVAFDRVRLTGEDFREDSSLSLREQSWRQNQKQKKSPL